jgi:hypothetical protein
MEFVSFEIAKKLKEKGFDVPCIYAYCEKGGWNMYTQKHEPITYVLRTNGNPFGTYYTGKNWNKEYTSNKNKIQCSAPTISQVLKWLREEKKIAINIEFIPYVWQYKIFDMYFEERFRPFGLTLFSDYEGAAITGIECALNLI